MGVSRRKKGTRGSEGECDFQMAKSKGRKGLSCILSYLHLHFLISFKRKGEVAGAQKDNKMCLLLDVPF